MIHVLGPIRAWSSRRRDGAGPVGLPRSSHSGWRVHHDWRIRQRGDDDWRSSDDQRGHQVRPQPRDQPRSTRPRSTLFRKSDRAGFRIASQKRRLTRLACVADSRARTPPVPRFASSPRVDGQMCETGCHDDGASHSRTKFPPARTNGLSDTTSQSRFVRATAPVAGAAHTTDSSIRRDPA